MRRVTLSREASAELSEAVAWYEEQRRGLGGSFLDAVAVTLAVLAERPRSFPPIDQPREPAVRRALLHRFPYGLVFLELGGGDLRVIAVAHAKRDPRYWLHRLR